MTTYLLDSNILSEPLKPDPNVREPRPIAAPRGHLFLAL